MTITIDRPDIADNGQTTTTQHRCAQGLSWCTGDPNNHDLDILHEDESIYHDSVDVDLPLTGGDERAANGFMISIERKDTLAGSAGPNRIYLATTRDRVPYREGGYATLEEAERIAREITAHVLSVRGMKRASDLRIGDRIAVDRIAQTVTGVVLDSASGALHVYTDLFSGCIAAQYKPSEMVPLRGQQSRITTNLTPAAINALARLSARQRTAMQLRYVNGMSTGETARVMGVRPDKVKTYLGRAKTQLREWGVLDAASALGGAA